MADEIIASVVIQRRLIVGAEQEGELHALIRRYATARLMNSTSRTVGRLRRDIIRLLARKYLPYAKLVGQQSAAPVLRRLGGTKLVDKGSKLRGPVLDWLNRYHKANLGAFRAELAKELGTLSGEVEAAFARAARDGVARKQLVTDLVQSHQDELKRLATVRKEIRKASADYRKATKANRGVGKARTNLRKAKAKLRTSKDFYARFETRVHGHARDAVRREAQRAQLATYRQAGFKGNYTWVAVNGPDACPSCTDLHGTTLPLSEWAGQMPGDGHTFCGDSCQCQLVPASFAEEAVEGPIRFLD